LTTKGLLEGKTALITGANRGIGQAVSSLFAAHGAEIIACVRKQSPGVAQSIAKDAGVDVSKIRSLTLDLEDNDSIKEISTTLTSDRKKVDILVNNAGYATGSRFQLTSAKELQKALQINFIGPMLLTQRLLRILESTDQLGGSSVVNISTSAVNFPDVGMTAYSASKAALEQSFRVLAKEVAPSNVRINTISPGPVETDMLNLMNSDAKLKLIHSTWMKRSAKSSEIASVALFLACDLSSYITGQTIHVNGGLG
jgi:3-oxoacyl-[acyl-carrier protein] reductase